jgi:hypothetical protein
MLEKSRLYRCVDMPGSCWRGSPLNVCRSAQSPAELFRRTFPSCLLPQPFGKAQRAQHQHRHSNQEERSHLRPKYLHADTFQENTPQNDKEVSEWIRIGDILKHLWHVFNGRHKAGEENGRLKKEEGRHHGLLRCLRYGRYE